MLSGFFWIHTQYTQTIPHHLISDFELRDLCFDFSDVN